MVLSSDRGFRVGRVVAAHQRKEFIVEVGHGEVR
jgi:hypothetical protein